VLPTDRIVLYHFSLSHVQHAVPRPWTKLWGPPAAAAHLATSLCAVVIMGRRQLPAAASGPLAWLSQTTEQLLLVATNMLGRHPVIINTAPAAASGSRLRLRFCVVHDSSADVLNGVSNTTFSEHIGDVDVCFAEQQAAVRLSKASKPARPCDRHAPP
jgi:hypothetical protein